MVRAAVLEPIGVPRLPVSRSIESDGSLGVPIMGWGGYPDVDATAKVARLLQDDGAHAGRQLLSRTKTREAMRRAGQAAIRRATPTSATFTRCGRCAPTPAAARSRSPDVRRRGNHVLMLPSGLSMVRFMDADNMEVRNATRAAEMYRSSCR